MTPEQLRKSLEDVDPEARRRTVMALENSGAEEAGELVLVALGDEDWRVRKEAVRVASALAERMSLVSDLVAAITQGENVGLRNAALEVLGHLGTTASPHLRKALDRVASHGRKFVVEALGDTGDPAVVPDLEKAAVDLDPNVAAAAIDALARIGGPEADRALRARLAAPDPFQRMAALDGLDRIGAVVPWEQLEPLLEDRLVRRVALRVLGRTGRLEAIAPLFEAMLEPSAHVVASAAIALCRLCASSPEVADEVARRALDLGDEPRSVLRDLVLHGDAEERPAAATVSLLARDAASLASVVSLAADGAMPREAMEAARRWGTGAVGPLLSARSSLVGMASAIALELAADLAAGPLVTGRSPDPSLASDVRRALRSGLSDPDPRVRLAAVRGLTWWAEDGDAPRLVALAGEGDEDLARAAGDVLARLAGRAERAVRDSLAPVPLEGTGGAALTSVVGKLGGGDAMERLQAALSADDAATRRAAVEALASVGGERAAEHVALALTDENVDVQTAAARALGSIRAADGRHVGTGHLLLALESESPAVRAAAARALGEAGEGRAVELLRELVREGAPGVAVAAMEGLRALKDPTFGDLLVEALGHGDPEVVKQALLAIQETDSERAAARLAVGLSHSAWDVRAMAAKLLGRVKGEDARRALEERLQVETDDLVRASIESALRGTGGRD